MEEKMFELLFEFINPELPFDIRGAIFALSNGNMLADEMKKEQDEFLLKEEMEYVTMDATDNAFKLIQSCMQETDRTSDAQDYQKPLTDLWWANANFANLRLLQLEYDEDMNNY